MSYKYHIENRVDQCMYEDIELDDSIENYTDEELNDIISDTLTHSQQWQFTREYTIIMDEDGEEELKVVKGVED